MVSLDPNPPTQDFYMDPMEMSFPSSNFIESTGDTVVDAYSSGVWCSEDPSKKVRKPYTITKSRESWTEQEHDKFLEALQLFDRDWKKIEAYVGSKTVIQIRSHAQKYFLKVQKNGTGEHVPPPRPKRKAAHPYPQKASKQAPVVSLITGPRALLESEYVRRPDSSSHCRSVFPNPTLSSWNPEIVAPLNGSDVTKDEMQVIRPSRANKCCSSSSNESTPRMWPSSEINDQGKGKLSKPARVVPDFAQVYSFIGSVFDPNASDHLQKLKNMDTINNETVLLLMKNLSVNLTSPEFENHRRLLSSYDVDTEKPKYNSLYNDLRIPKPQNAISAV